MSCVANHLIKDTGEYWTPKMAAILQGVSEREIMRRLREPDDLVDLVTKPLNKQHKPRGTAKEVLWEDSLREIAWTWELVYALFKVYDNETFEVTSNDNIRRRVNRWLSKNELGFRPGIIEFLREHMFYDELVTPRVKQVQTMLQEGKLDVADKQCTRPNHQDVADFLVKRKALYPTLIQYLPRELITEMVILCCKRVQNKELTI